MRAGFKGGHTCLGMGFEAPKEIPKLRLRGRALRLSTWGARGFEKGFQRQGLCSGWSPWTPLGLGCENRILESGTRRGSPRCWLHERLTSPCGVYPAQPGAAAAAAPGCARARGTRCRQVGTVCLAPCSPDTSRNPLHRSTCESPNSTPQMPSFTLESASQVPIGGRKGQNTALLSSHPPSCPA